MPSWVWFLLIGALAGFLAGLIWKGSGYGLLWNIIIGITGAVVGGFLFGLIGVSTGPGIIGELLSAVVGALVLLFVLSKVKFK